MPCLHIFLTLDPPLAQPPLLELKFQTDESSYFIEKATKFQNNCNRNGENSCLVLTNDMNGKVTYVGRYIRPQNPPHGFETLETVVRFVSMIPYLPNRTVFQVRCNLWSTTDQVLSIGAGDSIEHSILLCNYLLQLGYDAHVATGKSLIRGSCSFVLIPVENTFQPTNRQSSAILNGFNLKSLIRYPNSNEVPVSMYVVIDAVSGKIYNQIQSQAYGIEIEACFNDKNVSITNSSTISTSNNRKNFKMSLFNSPIPNSGLLYLQLASNLIFHNTQSNQQISFTTK